jgi:hypothetical protein
LDLAVLDAADSLQLAFELKIDDIGQTLWDMLKIASVTRLSDVLAGYVVVAARIGAWAAGGCADLLSPRGSVQKISETGASGHRPMPYECPAPQAARGRRCRRTAPDRRRPRADHPLCLPVD